MNPDALTHVTEHMREADRAELMETTWDNREADMCVHILAMGGLGYVCVADDGEPVAVAGITVCSPGVGQAWMWGTQRVKEVGLQVTRASIKQCKSELDGTLRRIQASTVSYHHDAHKWLEMVGFEREGRLRRFGRTGADFYMYSMIRG